MLEAGICGLVQGRLQRLLEAGPGVPPDRHESVIGYSKALLC